MSTWLRIGLLASLAACAETSDLGSAAFPLTFGEPVQLENLGSRKCLDVPGVAAEGAGLQQWTCAAVLSAAPQRVFRVEQVGTWTRVIHHASAKCVTSPGFSGGQLKLASCDGRPEQSFRLIFGVDPSEFQITTSNRLCFSVRDSNSGSSAIVASCSNSSTQVFLARIPPMASVDAGSVDAGEAGGSDDAGTIDFPEDGGSAEEPDSGVAETPAQYLRIQAQSGPLAWSTRCLTYRLDVPQQPIPGLEQAVRKTFDNWRSVGSRCGAEFGFAEGNRLKPEDYRLGLDSHGRSETQLIFRTVHCDDVVPEDDPCRADSKLAHERCGNAYQCMYSSDGTIGLTYVSFQKSTGRIFDADIEFNATSRSLLGRPRRFTANDGPVCATPDELDCVDSDIQNTLTHEVGHLLGFTHVRIQDSTMYESADYGETRKRVIDDGTREGLCSAYGGWPKPECQLKDVVGGCSTSGFSTLTLPLLTLLAFLRTRRTRRLSSRARSSLSASVLAGAVPWRQMLALVVLIAGGAVNAATFEPVPWQRLAEHADAVVVARVVRVESQFATPRRIVSVATLETLEVWKGEAVSQRLDVSTPGGEVGDVVQVVPGAAVFEAQQTLVLFLARVRGSVFTVVGLGRGAWVVNVDNSKATEMGRGETVSLVALRDGVAPRKSAPPVPAANARPQPTLPAEVLKRSPTR